MNPGRSTRTVLERSLLVLAVSALILGFAVYQGKAIIGRSDRPYRVETGRPVVPAVEGSRFLRSYEVKFNGLKTRFGHYASRAKADEVVSAYAARAKRDRATAAPLARIPALTSKGAGCSTYSYVARDGKSIGVVAFDNPESGGCDYFVGAMPAALSQQDSTGDCPGREPPGVPRPARSTRALCIENLGGVPSVMALYETWGRPSGIIEDLRHGMTENHWEERAESSRILTRNYEGSALLSFSRGHEQCIVGVDQEPRTGKIIILVFWAERPWLPRGVAL